MMVKEATVDTLAVHIKANIHKWLVQKANALVDADNSLLDDNTGKNDGTAAPADDITGKNDNLAAPELKFDNSHVILKHLNNFDPFSKKAVLDLLGLNPGSHNSFYPLKEVAETDEVQVQKVGG